MKWQKQGLIFKPTGEWEWSKTHAQIPVVDVLEDKLRIYYATRNSQGKSNISFIETDKTDPSKILYIHPKPILDFGPIGTFDDSGLMPSCIINKLKEKYLFYTGWNIGSNISYRLAIGLAISQDNGITFKKFSNGPILDRSIYDPCLVASPHITIEGSNWNMFYISGTKWEIINNHTEPFYHIKYANSDDGINWRRKGQIIIDYDDFTEGISRPSLLIFGKNYYLFYSYRNNTNYRIDKKTSYKIGYAVSTNGIDWKRKDDDIGITLSEEGWDSQMLAYPYIVEINNKIYMFYNGNGFGQSGFGYAILEDIL